MACVYRLTSPSGKQYIGFTTKTAEERFGMHWRQRLNNQGAMAKALRKYDRGLWEIETLCVGETEEMIILEQKLIKELGTLAPNGYNLRTDLANGGMSPEIKSRISKALKKAWTRDDYRRKRSLSTSISSTKMWEDPEHRRKMSEIFERPEHRKRASDVTRSLWEDENYRQKNMEARSQSRFDCTCIECGSHFKSAYRNRAKYCQPKCNQRHRRRRMRSPN